MCRRIEPFEILGKENAKENGQAWWKRSKVDGEGMRNNCWRRHTAYTLSPTNASNLPARSGLRQPGSVPIRFLSASTYADCIHGSIHVQIDLQCHQSEASLIHVASSACSPTGSASLLRSLPRPPACASPDDKSSTQPHPLKQARLALPTHPNLPQCQKPRPFTCPTIRNDPAWSRLRLIGALGALSLPAIRASSTKPHLQHISHCFFHASNTQVRRKETDDRGTLSGLHTYSSFPSFCASSTPSHRCRRVPCILSCMASPALVTRTIHVYPSNCTVGGRPRASVSVPCP
jgi:hypothetical protein